jgi:hypothetical protein
MRKIILMLIALISTVSLTAAEPVKDVEGFAAIFHGKDLTGWEGQPNGWKVENGCIVGESTPEKPCTRSHYLYYAADEPANFHFKMTFRMRGNGSNSGVQFRSEKRPNWDTYGYQADVDASGQWTGCLFHHKRAAVVQRGFEGTIGADGKGNFKQFADPAELLKFYKPGEWNTYEIIADGTKMTLIINDKVMCKVDDKHATEAAAKGIIALQMHQGPPMKVEFKEIKLKTL